MSNTARAKVYPARKFISKAGNDSYRQTIEVFQDNHPSLQIERFANQEQYVLGEGAYICTPVHYNRMYKLENGKTVYIVETKFGEFRKAE